MSYPLIIKDNFFPDPDAIERLIKEIDYPVSTGNWPGRRSLYLQEINLKLHVYITQKIFLLFHDQLPNFNMNVSFQKIKPFVDGDKWNKKNLGWIHNDACLFGGVIYLDKNPDKDAGTSIYKSKDGFDVPLTHESQLVKEKHFAGEQIYDEEYNRIYDTMRNQYEETLKISNLYNRLVLIPGDQPHAATTFGDKERNTIVFFCYDLMGVSLPEYKTHPLVPLSNHELYA